MVEDVGIGVVLAAVVGVVLGVVGAELDRLFDGEVETRALELAGLVEDGVVTAEFEVL